MILTFHGGAQSVTGSKHLVTLENGKRILLDCGMFQGKGNGTKALNKEFNFDPESVDYLILSHAHIDHSGLIPKLVRDGFTGKIFCTQPTSDFCKLLLEDSARIQFFSSNNKSEKNSKNNGNEEKGPLYAQEDVEKSLLLFKSVPYNKKYNIDEDIELIFTDTGHILGSAAVNLSLKENGRTRHLCFTGDIGRFENRILKPPQPFPQAEIIICESTYGDKFHSSIEQTEERLEAIVKETCVEKGGKLIIPSFSIGRTQELIYSLNYLAEEGRLPDIKVFVDSPLSVYATDITRSYMEYFNDSMLEYIKTDPDPFGFPQLHFIIDQDDSKLLNALDEPCVIISSSGMMEAGRIQHHLKLNISDPRSTILMTGYCEPSTLGGQILNGAEKVKIFDEEYEVKANILVMKEYSAHADYGDILKFLFCQEKDKIEKLFLVHGEYKTMEKFKSNLEESDYKNIIIAESRISYQV
ncbi:MBL fold metallo-hydrolase [soil metagenome]